MSTFPRSTLARNEYMKWGLREVILTTISLHIKRLRPQPLLSPPNLSAPTKQWLQNKQSRPHPKRKALSIFCVRFYYSATLPYILFQRFSTFFCRSKFRRSSAPTISKMPGSLASGRFSDLSLARSLPHMSCLYSNKMLVAFVSTSDLDRVNGCTCSSEQTTQPLRKYTA